VTDYTDIVRRLRAAQSDADGDFWPLAEDAADAIEALEKERDEALVSVSSPAGDALDDLWKHIILSRKPDYGPWEYPAQAYRHLAIEYDELRARVAFAQADLREMRGTVDVLEIKLGSARARVAELEGIIRDLREDPEGL
jgi:hypothetical protein